MADEKIYKNVMRCGLCQAPADRIGGPPKVYGKDYPGWYFQCQSNSCHMADGFTGIFSDLSYPKKMKMPCEKV